MKDGLYYCLTDIYTVHDTPAIRCCPAVHRIATPVDATPSIAASQHRARSRFVPTSKAKQIESEVWLLCLGSPGAHQLDLLPGHVRGIPSEFRHHPFHFIDHKESALVKKQPAQHSAVCTSECKQCFYMDFGFMRSSTSDYARPNKATDRLVLSYDGFNSYLLIIDEVLHYAWVFLTKSKKIPCWISFARFSPCMAIGMVGVFVRTKVGNWRLVLHLVTFFFKNIDTPWSPPVQIAPRKTVLSRYIMTNSAFAHDPFCMVLASLLSTGPRLWSTLFIYTTIWSIWPLGSTPFEVYNKQQLDLEYLKTFGSWVCVKCSGDHRAKLDRHDFQGIFLGFMAKDQNIVYLDLDTGIAKQSHHATFNEAWYLQPSRPLAAQLLYDLGLEAETIPISSTGPA